MHICPFRRKTYLGGLVFRGGDKVGTVSVELDVVDLVVEFVGLDVLELFTGLQTFSQKSSPNITLPEKKKKKKYTPSSHTG